MPEENIKKKEKEVSERILKKVNKLYENYGIDPEGLDEGDINRVYRHYANNEAELDSDYKKSVIISEKI
jgi:hypothetical protein